jgi:hypothetical protein
MMSYGESAVEAREVLNRSTETLMERRAEELGIRPEELPESEKAAIKAEAASAANVAFGLNMGILSATNFVTFGKMLMPKYSNMRPQIRGFAKDIKTGKFVDKWKDNKFWGGVVDRYIKEPVKSGASEAFQEGSQFLIQEAADTVIDKGGNSWVEDWTEALVEGYGDVYGTKEGKESMLLGAVIGMLMGGFGSVNAYAKSSKEDKQRSKLLESLNNPQFNNMLERAKHVKNGQEILQRMQDSLEQGDHKAYRDAQFELIANEVAMHEKAGSLDLFMEKLDDAGAMEDAEFAEAFGIPEGVEFNKTEIVAGVKNKVKEYQELKEKVDAAFPTRPKQGIDRLFMSKDAKIEEQNRLEDEQFLKDRILAHGMGLSDKDGRIDNLISDLNELHAKHAIQDTEQRLTKEDFSDLGPVAHIVEVDDQGQTTVTGGAALKEESAAKIDKIVADITASNALDGKEAQEKARDLKRIVRDRAVVAGSLNELMGDPATRSSAIAREKMQDAAKRQQKYESGIRERMDKTYTYDELNDLIKAINSEKGIGVSPEFKKSVKEELEKRRDAEKILNEEMEYQSVGELESQLDGEKDRVRKHVLAKHIEMRKEEGRFEASARPEKTKSESRKDRKEAREERKKQREQRRSEQAEENKEKETGESTTGDVVGEPATVETTESLLAELESKINDPRFRGPEVDGKEIPWGKKSFFSNKLKQLREVLKGGKLTTAEQVEKATQLLNNLRAALNEGINLNTEEGVSLIQEIEDLMPRIAESIEVAPEAVTEYKNELDRKLQSRGQGPLAKRAVRSRDGSVTVDGKNFEYFFDRDSTGGGGSAGTTSSVSRTVEIANGELKLTPEYRVVVDGAGRVTVGNDSNQSAPINRAKTKEEGLEGKTVEYRLLPVNENGFVSVGAFVDGELIGVLSGKSADSIRPLLENGQEVTGKVVKRFFSNIANTSTADGNEVFRSAEGVSKMAGFLGYGVIKDNEIDLGGIEGTEDAKNKLTARLSEMKFTPGQIVAVFRLPNGEFKPLAVSTKKVGDAGAQRLTQLISENEDLSVLKDEYGIRYMPRDGVRFIVEQLQNGDLIVSFNNGDKIVSYNYAEFAKLMRGENAKFTVGEFIEEIGEDEELEVKFKKDGTVSAEQRADLASTAKETAYQAMAEVRMQVDKKKLKYPKEVERLERDVIEVDFVATEGNSPFYDVAIKMSAQSAVVEQVVEEATIPAEEPQPVSARKEEAEVPDADTEYSDDDLFGEPAEGQDDVDPETGEAYTEDDFAFSPGTKLPDGRYEVQYENNTYVVDFYSTAPITVDTITNKKTGETILSTSSVGKAVVNKAIGQLPYRLGEQPNLFTKTGDSEAAKKFLQERFGEDSVTIFNTMQMVGDAVVHGYVQNGAVHLWNNAELGTEFHEAFHLFFRSSLNDSQREGLYQEAVEKYGEPTAAEIAAARRGQTELSNAEARLLALEEKMAEDFRDFMLNEEEIERTLPQRIAKFFKDMLAYIKAAVFDNVGINQAFSLIEKNRIPKRFSRNASAFSPGPAFMLKQYAANPQMHKELIDIAVYKTLKSMELMAGTGIRKSEMADILLGNPVDQESEVRNWFLRQAFHLPGGRPMTDMQFADLKNAYDQGREQAREVIQAMGLRPGAPLVNQYGEPLPANMVQNGEAARHFRSVYDRWFDVEGELGGTELRGFRSEIVDRLKPYGYKISDTQKVEDADAEFERIYGISRMKENPAKKLNDKAKRTLSRIPVSSTDGTFFGFQTYVPIEDIFTEIAGTVYNSSNIDEMLERLDIRSQNIPYLRDVFNFVNNLSDQEKALFYSSMSLTMNEFRIVMLDKDENGKTISKIFNPGATSTESFYTSKWKTASRKSGGLYSVKIDREGIPRTSINRDKAKRAINYLKLATSEIVTPTEANYNALANGLWELGIELGPTKEIARQRVADTFRDRGTKWGMFLSSQGANISQIAEDLKDGLDVHTEDAGRMNVIAHTITKNFVAPPAMSFVNVSGSVVFPLNQKTDLAITRELMESGEYAEMVEGTLGHMAGDVRTLGTALMQSEAYQKEFVPVDLDGLKITGKAKDQIYEYSDLSFENALAVSMIMQRNASNPDVMYIAVDTQADRDRLTFIPIPNWMKPTRDAELKYSLDITGSRGDRIRKVLKDQILVDLYRIAMDNVSEDNDIVGYHTNEQYRMMQTGRVLEESEDGIAAMARDYIEAEVQGAMPKELAQFIDAEIQRVNELILEYKQEIIEEFGSEENFKAFIANKVPGVKTDGEFQALDDFLVADVVGRMVSRQIFRSGINYTKDGADYNKRSGLTTTPGIVLMIRREAGGYGMKETFNEITIQDVVKSLPADSISKFTAKLDELGLTPDEIENIINPFTEIETTDAQAFITMDMYRSIRQGMGMWTTEDDALYEEYQATGKWKGKLKPLKPSYEFRAKHNNHLVPISHKNSYIVLTDELVEGIPAMRQLLDRMEAKGRFQGLQQVDVVNTISAKKLGSFIPVDGMSEEALMNAPVQTLDSRGLKFPQILPETFKDRMTFGRQPRKNMIANINDDTDYVFNGKKIKGSELKRIYQNALTAKLELNKQRIFRELGYDKVLETEPGTAERQKAVEDMLPKLRKKMQDLGVEKDYTQNFLDALQLTKDEEGNLTTRLPLSFPSVHSKLDQLLLGLFRTEVYQQKLTGQEMVQFAEFGELQEGNDLAFYSIEGENIVEAEVDIHPAVLRAMGVDINQPIEEINKEVQRLLGYRIPQQGKSSMLVMKIRRLLPESAVTSVRVPAGITTMMGSDFDIDKLFVIFPELENGKRVEFDVRQDPATMTEKQLNNMIFETFAAVGTNVAHLDEILGGVEIGDLQQARARLLGEFNEETQKWEGGKPVIDINSPVQRIDTGIANMLSGVLRGAYANAIAGRNVALASGVEFKSSSGREMTVDGQTLDRLTEKSPFTGKYTDQYMSQYLSAAVDSVKDPLQEQINDNALTADLTTYMLSMGMTPTQAVAFLNIPVIRSSVKNAMDKGVSLNKYLGQVEPVDIVLDSEEMMSIARGEKVINAAEEDRYLGMLVTMVEEAQALSNLYKLLTPDAIDKAGTTAQHLALLDRAQSMEDSTFGGTAALREITQGDAYPIVKAYYTAINQSLEVGRRVGFIGTQPAVIQAKDRIKKLVGKSFSFFNEKQHRDINRAILHYIVTQPGSPLFESGLLDDVYVESLFLNGGISSLFEEAKQQNGGAPNIVLDSLELVTEPIGDDKTYTYLRVDPSKVKTTLEKDMWTATLDGMISSGKYSPFVRGLFTNMIVSSGFAPGPYAAFDMLPVSMFEGMGVSAHLNQEMKNLNAGSDYLSQIGFIDEFLASYGTHRIGKEMLISETFDAKPNQMLGIKKNGIPQGDRTSRFLVVKAGKERYLAELDEAQGMYLLRNTKGKQYTFYEANIRNRDTGEKLNRSLIHSKRPGAQSTDSPGIDNPSPKLSKLELTQKDTPMGAQAKIDRLSEAFAAAGIDVVVEQGELPTGVKGQVEGNVITFDPEQMSEDTVYHEFGHILVDMLPESDVKKYIQQVVKADPTLARTVSAKYPELEGLALGKEILVTAIGLEGAKLERKNPSKLQRLINKIMRAIGKLFGVEPNAAAILADEMFGKEIRRERLSGQFNKKLQRSKDLRDELKEVTESTLKSLTRQKMRLENLPESELNKERIREIKTLERNIRKVQQREDTLEAFFDFNDYVIARVDKLWVLMDEAKRKMAQDDLTKDERLELLRQIGEMKMTIDSLYNTVDEKSTVTKVRKLLRRMDRNGEIDDAEGNVRAVLDDLADSLDDLKDLNDEYLDIIYPLQADILLTSADFSINDEIDALIKQVRETKDISGYGRFAFLQRNPEYLKLRGQLRRKEITNEEFKEQVLEVKIEELKKKRVGREQLIQEMRDAHKSKGWFSHYMDPMIYSSEANLQLFSIVLKDALNNATDNTRGFLFQLEDKYNKIKSYLGSDFNEARFNEPLLTTVNIDGVELLSLVSQYDTQKFYGALEAEKARLNEKYNVPEGKEEYLKWKYQETEKGKSWTKEYKDYRRELRKWYKENTDPIEDATTILNELDNKIAILKQKIAAEEDRDRKNIMYTELEDLKNKKLDSYAQDGTFMGDLAVPKMYDEEGNRLYASEKYERIQSDPELKEYYDFILETYRNAQKQIGNSELFVDSWDTMSYIMPSVRKDRIAALQQEGWKDLIQEVGADFTRLDTDTQFGMMTDQDGERIKSIPRFYTNRVEARNVSRDIAASMAQFVHMANMFEEKSKVVGVVEAMLTIHEQRKTIPVDATGIPIIDKVSQIARGVEEGLVEEDPRNNRNYKHLKEFVDSVFYGQLDLDEGSILGINMSKLSGKAASFTAVANLAFNTLQVGNQFILDNLMGTEEAVAGQFFGKKDFAWAAATYAANKGALSDVGAFVAKSKLGQAMMMFDALNEVTDNIGKKVTGSRLKKAMQSDVAFALQHAVEHQSTGTRMLALLRSYKGKLKDKDGNVLMNEQGQEADLWDMLIEDDKGMLIIDPRVANVTKNQVIGKLHGINKRANQIKGSHDRSMGNRRAIGKLALLFRNYFTPGLRKRFGHGSSYHVDYELGAITRGMYNSLMGYFANIPQAGGIISAYQMMTDTDKQNMRRVIYDAAFAVSTYTIYAVLNSMLDDDENEDNYALAYAAYQARRLHSELTQFVRPGEFLNMAQAPMATLNWLEKYATIANQVLIKEPGYAVGLVDADDIFYQRRTGTAEKGDRKVLNQIKKVVPVLNGYQTSFLKEGSAAAVEEKLRWFD